MVYDILNFLWERKVMEYAFYILLIFLIGHYVLPYVWAIRQEKRDALEKSRREKIVAAEQKIRKRRELATERKRLKSLPSYCPMCKTNAMVRIGAALEGGILLDRYKCSECLHVKYIPRGL